MYVKFEEPRDVGNGAARFECRNTTRGNNPVDHDPKIRTTSWLAERGVILEYYLYQRNLLISSGYRI